MEKLKKSYNSNKKKKEIWIIKIAKIKDLNTKIVSAALNK